MKISMIAAIGKNRELGEANKLIWRISTDLQRLKSLTMGHPIVMGRKTFESIGHVLPGRTNIIITRDIEYKGEHAVIVKSIEEAIEAAKNSPGSDEVFILGGAQIFKQLMDQADKLYLTLINEENPNADAYFPDYSMFKKEINREKGEENGLKFEYVDLER